MLSSNRMKKLDTKISLPRILILLLNFMITLFVGIWIVFFVWIGFLFRNGSGGLGGLIFIFIIPIFCLIMLILLFLLFWLKGLVVKKEAQRQIS
jgi:hypothetical protein